VCLSDRLSAGEEFDAIGDPLVPARHAAIGCATARRDRSEADHFSKLADRFEQGSARRSPKSDPDHAGAGRSPGARLRSVTSLDRILGPAPSERMRMPAPGEAPRSGT
jgi:hypothetical protein